MLLDNISVEIDQLPRVTLELGSSTTDLEINVLRDPIIVELDRLPTIPLFLLTDND